LFKYQAVKNRPHIIQARGRALTLVLTISTASSVASADVAGYEHPTTPNLFLITVLHRHDGYVSFASKDGDDFHLRFAIRADALESYFPQFLDQLTKNSLVSINASHRTASRKHQPVGFPCHRNESLRFLCSCYCDVDFYKHGLTFAQVQREIHSLCESGALPRPSIIVDSGHGLWLLWLLHDETDPTKAHLGAYGDNACNHLQLYTKINRAIGQRLIFLGADLGATDGARYIRVPGSFRTDHERYIHWDLQSRAGRPRTYTLKELADFFSIPLERRLPQEERAIAEAASRCPSRSRGWTKTNQNRLAAFLTLKDLRAGGFDAGCRNFAAFIYASSLKATGVTKKDALHSLTAMAALCRPPLSSSECEGAVKSAWKQKSFKLRYHRMAGLLKVSLAEAEIISRTIGRPFPEAGGGVAEFPEESRATRQAGRRHRIRCIVENLDRPPSYREMKNLLFAHGISAGHVTIMADYHALGLVPNRPANRTADTRQLTLV
jgi:hypothetical protein